MTLRERKQQRTRRRILDVSLDLFCRKGIESVTLAEIAAAAEVGATTFYRYFPTKDDLLQTLYVENLTAFGTLAEMMSDLDIADRTSISAAFQSIVRTFEGVIETERSRQVVVFDLFFNVYALQRRQDPTTFEGHPFSSEWYRRFHAAGHVEAELFSESINLLYGYAQRLIMLEYQKTRPEWDRVKQNVRLLTSLVENGFLNRSDEQ